MNRSDIELRKIGGVWLAGDKHDKPDRNRLDWRFKIVIGIISGLVIFTMILRDISLGRMPFTAQLLGLQ